jgi:hypothetical protein
MPPAYCQAFSHAISIAYSSRIFFTVFSPRLFEKCAQGEMPWCIGLDLIPAAGLFNVLTYFQ